VDEGLAAVDGELGIPGVSGTGAPVRLEFLNPGGATTGRLLPTGNVIDVLDVPGIGRIEASLVDAANACVFVRAEDVGLTGIEMPEALDADSAIMEKLGAIRLAASVAMGIAKDTAGAAKITTVPFIGFVAAAQDAKTLSGEPIDANAIDLTGRIVSSGQTHRALPLTASLCMAVAARLEGSVVNQLVRASSGGDAPIRIGMPSGVLVVAATVEREHGRWIAQQGAFYRTARRLFEGAVYLRASRVASDAVSRQPTVATVV
jgi:2-methylaconitate cis-trans-isomerase PrpF